MAPHAPHRLRGLALLLLCLATPAAADWKREYALGLRAVEQGDWPAAERHMRAALAEDGEASERKRFQGVKFDRYVPHWYAGLAAFRQGDCSRAADYWDDASSSRVVAGLSDQAAEQRRLRAECTSRLAAREPAPATPAPTSGSTSATSAPPPATPARAGVRDSASTAAAQPPAGASRDGAAASPPRVAAAPPPAASAPAASAPTPPRAASPGAGKPTASSAASPVAAAQRSGPPPAELRRALDGWLAGRYDDVLRVDPAAVSDARGRAQLLLLRGAARLVLAELAGSPDAAALEAVREEVRAARRSAASVKADEALFPPRFRSLVAATR